MEISVTDADFGAHRQLIEKWSSDGLLLLLLIACAISWLLYAMGMVVPDLYIHAFGFSIPASALLIVAASVLPGVLLLILFKDSRVFLLTFKARAGTYLLAVVVGFALPLCANFGSQNSGPLWDHTASVTFVRVFLINIFLTPLWEEILWRGFYYPKVRLNLAGKTAIVAASAAWTVWHLGYITFLYHGGLPLSVLFFLPVQYFCMGIILCSLFELGRSTLLPCILLHASVNASGSAYFA